MKKIVSFVAAFAALAFANSANAADMPAKAPVYKAPMAAPVFNWTGFYVGVDAGYLWSRIDLSDPAVPAAGSAPGKPNSFTFGGHAGYLYQFNIPVVIGAEVDASWLNGSSTTAFSGSAATSGIVNTKWDASLRAIFGYALDTTLFYATGGASWLNSNGCFASTAALPACAAATNYSNTRSGWTAGAGVSHAFTPNLIARVEYLYADYGNFNYVAPGVAGGIGNVSEKTNKIRAGLSWKF